MLRFLYAAGFITLFLASHSYAQGVLVGGISVIQEFTSSSTGYDDLTIQSIGITDYASCVASGRSSAGCTQMQNNPYILATNQVNQGVIYNIWRMYTVLGYIDLYEGIGCADSSNTLARKEEFFYWSCDYDPCAQYGSTAREITLASQLTFCEWDPPQDECNWSSGINTATSLAQCQDACQSNGSSFVNGVCHSELDITPEQEQECTNSGGYFTFDGATWACTGDLTPYTYDDTDSDGDGVPNDYDPDIDGDGIPNAQDTTPYGDSNTNLAYLTNQVSSLSSQISTLNQNIANVTSTVNNINNSSLTTINNSLNNIAGALNNTAAAQNLANETTNLINQNLVNQSSQLTTLNNTAQTLQTDIQNNNQTATNQLTQLTTLNETAQTLQTEIQNNNQTATNQLTQLTALSETAQTLQSETQAIATAIREIADTNKEGGEVYSQLDAINQSNAEILAALENDVANWLNPTPADDAPDQIPLTLGDVTSDINEAAQQLVVDSTELVTSNQTISDNSQTIADNSQTIVDNSQTIVDNSQNIVTNTTTINETLLANQVLLQEIADSLQPEPPPDTGEGEPPVDNTGLLEEIARNTADTATELGTLNQTIDTLLAETTQPTYQSEIATDPFDDANGNGVSDIMDSAYTQIEQAPITQAITNFGATITTGGDCPRPSFSVFNQTFVMDMHCTLFSQIAGILSALMYTVWTITAFRVLVSA